MVVYSTEVTEGDGKEAELRCERLAAKWNISGGNKSARLKPRGDCECSAVFTS